MIEWLLIKEINMNGIIFWIEKKIKIIVQSIYIEIIDNQKCKGGSPNFNINLIFIIIKIKRELITMIKLTINEINNVNDAMS